VLRVGGASVLWRPRVAAVGAVLLALLVLLCAVSVGRGDHVVPLGDVLAVLTGGGDPLQRLVVLELRLPRALTGALVGAALGLSGAITQSVTRNPLASPDVLGISAGAGAAAVAVIVLGGGTVAGTAQWVGLPLAALAGGLLTALAGYLLAWRDGVDGYRLVLIGIAIAALGTATTAWLLTRARITDAAQAFAWLTGSLNGRDWHHVVPVAAALLVCAVAAAPLARTLDALRFDDDTVRALGVRAEVGRAGLVTVAVALAAVATAAAGPVTFVALVAPQIALRLVRSSAPPLALAALLGAVLLVACDLVSRTVLPVELPVGVVTAAVGAPYLLLLLLRRSRRATV
jgi:iron complex transport system permease protein